MTTELVARTTEPNYLESPGTDPGHSIPGIDTTVSDVSIQNALQRMNLPSSAEAYQLVEGNFEGALTCSGTMSAGDLGWHGSLFGTTSAPYTPTTGVLPSERWYVGARHGASSVIEREIMGLVVGEATITYTQGETVTFELTCFYGDETENTSFTPGTQPEPTNGGQGTLVFHGCTFQVPGGTTLAKVQSGTLSLTNNYRAQRGTSRTPLDVVMGNFETTLELEKIVTSNNLVSTAYGSSGSAPATGLGSSFAATFSATSPAGGIDYSLSKAKADSAAWSDLGDPESDAMDSITINGANVEAATTTGA